MQPYQRYLIAANNYRDYRPASQAVFSVVYMSVTMVSTTFSVARRLISATWTTRIDANSYRDYRPASQAVFSVVYTSFTTVNQYYFQCGKKIYRYGHIDATPILTIDWPCRQCSRSSMSAVIISQYEFSE